MSDNTVSSVPPLQQRKWLWIAAICVSALVVYFIISWFGGEETDDAYIDAHVISIMPKVPAYVTTLHVDDNSKVNKDELLVELDPRDYQVLVDAAHAGVDSAASKLAEAQAQLNVSNAEAVQSDAEADVAEANAKLADSDLRRFKGVSDVRAISKEKMDTVRTAAESGHASAHAARMKANAAKARAELAAAQVKTAQAALAQARTALDQAMLNLSYTRITATEAATVANKTVEAGNYVQPGQLLFYLIPRQTYVIANFKETQVENIEPGAHATIRVDAFPGMKLHGHVDSIQRGSGSRFALLPPENATGNFVKVVQRLPVKIILDEPDETLWKLAPGMSVEASVSTSWSHR